MRKIILAIILLMIVLVACDKNEKEFEIKTNKNTDKREAVLPFEIIEKPIKKLALINFENDKDENYYGLELLYIDSQETGSGYRVMAYRNDGFVDIYEEKSLNPKTNKNESIAGKGDKNYSQISIESPILEKDDTGNIIISFEFTDHYGRNIEVDIREKDKENSQFFSMLAPVGASSEDPNHFPLYLLYDFDFVKDNSDIKIEIDGKSHEPDPFPVNIPVRGYKRNFVRYSLDTNMVELFKETDKAKELILDDQLSYTDENGSFTYYYTYAEKDDELQMKYIKYNNKNSFIIEFTPALSFDDKLNGEILIRDEANKIGKIIGNYSINKSKILEINFDKGWQAPRKSLIEKIIFNGKSIFTSWPKKYYYIMEMDDELNKKESWINKKTD